MGSLPLPALFRIRGKTQGGIDPRRNGQEGDIILRIAVHVFLQSAGSRRATLVGALGASGKADKFVVSAVPWGTTHAFPRAKLPTHGREVKMLSIFIHVERALFT